MANYNVDIAVAVKNIQTLDKLKRELKEIEQAYSRLTGSKADVKAKSADLRREIGLEEEVNKRLKVRERILGRLSDMRKKEALENKRSAEIIRQRGARPFAGGRATDPTGPDVALRSYEESQQRAIKAEKELSEGLVATKQNAEKVNMAFDLRAQQTERLGKQRREAFQINQRELAFEDRLNNLFKERGLLTDKQMTKEEKMRRRRINAAVTGGGFPLLFGGGPFQALGGAVGGAVSGEMFSAATVGLQVFGGFVDKLTGSLIRGANELSLATTRTDGDIEKVLNSLGRTGDASLDYIRSLDTTTTKVFALKAANEELSKVVGQEGVDNLQRFGEQSRRLQNELQAFFTNLSANVAGLIANQGGLDDLSDMLERPRLLDAAQRSAEDNPRMALLLAQRQNAVGRERLDIVEQILDLQREIEESASTELGHRQTQLSIFMADLAARQQAFEQNEAAEAAAGRDIANRLNAGDDVVEVLNRQLRVAKATTDEERLLARQQNQRETTLARIHESQKQGVNALLNELFAQQRINEAVKEREKLRSFASTRTASETARDDLNREMSLLAAKLQGKEEEFLLEDKIKKLRAQGIELDEVSAYYDLLKLVEEREKQERTVNNALKAQTKKVKEVHATYKEMSNTLTSGLITALDSVIKKTQSLGDAVKDVLVDIGDMLLRMGIETAAKAGFEALFSLGRYGGSPQAPSQFFSTPAPALPPISPNAAGGYITGPTNTVLGEGGESEYVIPESKMRESMARYSRGARGSSVIPESGEAGTVGGGGGTAVAAPIDVRYTVERINDVEYVTAAQFQAGMQQAAAQGAQRGEQQTLRRLQMSGSTRRRIGL